MNDVVLFHDVDGCLNAPDGAALALAEHEFTQSEKVRLQQFGRLLDQSAVAELIINTGRSWEATSFICEAIDSAKLRYALVEHGAELWDVATQSPIDFGGVETASDETELTRALASRNQLAEVINWFVHEGASELAASMGYSGSLPHASDKSWNLTFSVPPQLDGDDMLRQLRRLIGQVPEFQDAEFVYHYSRWNRFLDVMGQMDKGLGMTAVSELLGIDAARIAALGDGLNDLPMLERAAIPVCPANAEPKVIHLCGTRGHASAGMFIDGTMDWIGRL